MFCVLCVAYLTARCTYYSADFALVSRHRSSNSSISASSDCVAGH